jgi:uncharacterized BrkB/YihY/UPF0761 family membrane protein
MTTAPGSPARSPIFAFLSFFPILALAFFVVGYVARVYPCARDNLIAAIGTMLPHILGTGEGEIRLDTVQNAAGTAGLFGAIGLLSTGLGWLSGMRAALEVLKLGSTVLLATTRGRPAFQAFGIALIMLVWIKYFSRVVMLAAAWAHTSAPGARSGRVATTSS